MARILLFIPMYNCEKQITRVLDQLSRVAGGWFEEAIIVNNRSTDGGEEAVIRCLTQGNLPCGVTLLRNRENYGLGGSHKVAFQYAIQHGFDYIVVLHGDDQGHLEDILPIFSSGDYLAYDCCLGARFMRGSRLEGYSRFRTFGNKAYNLLFSCVTGRQVHDLGSGLNMYRVSALRSGYYEKFCDNLQFNYCMILALAHLKQTVRFFPIRWSEEDQISNVKLTRQAINVLKLLGSFALSPRRLLQRELREVPRVGYEADVVYSTTGTGGNA